MHSRADMLRSAHACEGSFTDRYQLDLLAWFEH